MAAAYKMLGTGRLNRPDAKKDVDGGGGPTCLTVIGVTSPKCPKATGRFSDDPPQRRGRLIS